MERWVTASTPIGVTFERASRILTGDVETLLPSRHPADATGRFVAALSVETRGGTAVRQDVLVTLGSPCSAEGETWVPIEWEPAAHSGMLPSFTGVLELVDAAGGAELALTGIYDVPLGVVGHFGDALVGRRVAQHSIRTLLDDMARQVRDRAVDEAVHAGWRPAPYPISFRERDVPELPASRGAADERPPG